MSWLHLSILGALLGVACVADLWARRIPNLLVALVAGTGVGLHLWAGGLPAAAGGVLAGGIAFAVLFLPWRFRVLGGGDLKLLSAVAIWMGPSRLLAFAIYTGLAGIPVALAAFAAHRLRLWQLVRSSMSAGQDGPVAAPPRASVPVAVAITMGAFVTLLLVSP